MRSISNHRVDLTRVIGFALACVCLVSFPGVAKAVPKYEELMVDAENEQKVGRYAEAAARYGDAYRALAEDDRVGGLGEATVDAALQAYDLALAEQPNDLALLKAEAALLQEFMDERAAGDVPTTIAVKLARTQGRIIELEREREEQEASETAPEAMDPPTDASLLSSPPVRRRPRIRLDESTTRHALSGRGVARWIPTGFVAGGMLSFRINPKNEIGIEASYVRFSGFGPRWGYTLLLARYEHVFRPDTFARPFVGGTMGVNVPHRSAECVQESYDGGTVVEVTCPYAAGVFMATGGVKFPLFRFLAIVTEVFAGGLTEEPYVIAGAGGGLELSIPLD